MPRDLSLCPLEQGAKKKDEFPIAGKALFLLQQCGRSHAAALTWTVRLQDPVGDAIMDFSDRSEKWAERQVLQLFQAAGSAGLQHFSCLMFKAPSVLQLARK